MIDSVGLGSPPLLAKTKDTSQVQVFHLPSRQKSRERSKDADPEHGSCQRVRPVQRTTGNRPPWQTLFQYPALPARRHGGKSGVVLGGQGFHTASKSEHDDVASPSMRRRRCEKEVAFANAQRATQSTTGFGAN